MKPEILLCEEQSTEAFLALLYQFYPYDIEEKMVLTLLEKDTFPHPALLQFIEYYASISKYRLVNETPSPSINQLCAKMSALYQTNKNALHTYVFQFDASLCIQSFQIKSPYAHLCFAQIPFLTKIYLHTIPIFTMESKYKETEIVQSRLFPYKDISIDAHDYIAISIQIDDKHGFIYIPKNQIGIAISLATIYEIVPPPTEIDFIVLYGLSSHDESYSYFFDETNQIYTGLISGHHYQHFIYVMKMITTLYNAICIEKNDLPIHACMLTLRIGKHPFGIVIMGDTFSGKSEVCESIRYGCERLHIATTCVFEDCGTLHYLDNDLSATGIQIGACVSIQGLPKQRIFSKMPGCIFLQYKHKITHVLFPFASFEDTCQFHRVHALYYLNPSHDHFEARNIHQLEKAKQFFMKGMHSLEFCDPYGGIHVRCEQQKKQLKSLIDSYLNLIMINEIQLGEIRYNKLDQEKDKFLSGLLKSWIQQAKEK